jgi:hypothetical protein
MDGGIVVILLLRRMDGSDSTFAWNKRARGISSDEASASSGRDCCAMQRTYPETILFTFVVTVLDCDCNYVSWDSCSNSVLRLSRIV